MHEFSLSAKLKKSNGIQASKSEFKKLAEQGDESSS